MSPLLRPTLLWTFSTAKSQTEKLPRIQGDIYKLYRPLVMSWDGLGHSFGPISFIPFIEDAQFMATTPVSLQIIHKVEDWKPTFIVVDKAGLETAKSPRLLLQ